MALNLSSLSIADAEMPASTRGRKAEPLPAELVAAVKESYSGIGKSVALPKDGKVNKNGDDTALVAFRSILRRAANELDYGISITTGKETAKTIQVLFKAKDKNIRHVENSKDYKDAVAFWTENPESEPDDETAEVWVQAYSDLHTDESDE